MNLAFTLVDHQVGGVQTEVSLNGVALLGHTSGGLDEPGPTARQLRFIEEVPLDHDSLEHKKVFSRAPQLCPSALECQSQLLLHGCMQRTLARELKLANHDGESEENSGAQCQQCHVQLQEGVDEALKSIEAALKVFNFAHRPSQNFTLVVKGERGRHRRTQPHVRTFALTAPSKVTYDAPPVLQLSKGAWSVVKRCVESRILAVLLFGLTLPQSASAHGFGVGGAWLSLDAAPTHFASAPATALFATLAAAGWTSSSPCDETCCSSYAALQGQAPAYELQRLDSDSGRMEALALWLMQPSPHGLPLWALQLHTYGEGYASVVAGQHLTDDLLGGIALLRNATSDSGPALPWVELRHAPNEIDALIEPVNGTACTEEPWDESASSSMALLPPVLPLEEPVTDTLVWRENAERKHVALTFDACSTFTHGGEYNRAVIDTLIANDIPATLFIGGHWAETHPEELAWLAAQPLFELGNHTYSHPHMPQLSKARQRQELLWTQYIIYSLTGQLPRFFPSALWGD